MFVKRSKGVKGKVVATTKKSGGYTGFKYTSGSGSTTGLKTSGVKRR